LLANSLIAGVAALLWLILRSGSKPSRLAYPCQQAAVSAAALAFGAPLVSAVLAARRGLIRGLRRPAGAAVAASGLALTIGVWGMLSRAEPGRPASLDPPPDYRAKVFHVRDCPQDPIGDRFVGVDNLINLMGRGGLKLYQSQTQSLVSGPEGIIAPTDVVVVKINYQWAERGGTNTDVLRGVIRRLFDHPDGFTGEVVVCENAQFNSIDGFDRAANNAQNTAQSPHDVVAGFQAQGYPISHFDWTALRNTQVSEYNAGDYRDGYIVEAYDPGLIGYPSYPKFRTSRGTYISLRYGVWRALPPSYDRERLKFINLPVLKSHHASYGVTACTKHYMGVVTGALGTNSHASIRYGMMGALMGEIQPADLNILDCIWINANPNDGPWTTYEAATRRDELVAAVDPIAADLWAVKNILIPAFLANGYLPPWPTPSADPDNPNSAFRYYLDNSMNRLLAAGYSVTNDPSRIDLTTWNGAGDADGDSDVDLVDAAALLGCLSGPDGPAAPGCDEFDFQADGDVDLWDFSAFQTAYTGPGIF